MVLNIAIPLFTFGVIVFTDSYNSQGKHVCLGEGYQLFFSTKLRLCTYENLFAKIACTIWIIVQVICMSNIIDLYCIYCCIKEIKKSTEKTKNMLSTEAYNNRKR